jgi:hypothetical protein
MLWREQFSSHILKDFGSRKNNFVNPNFDAGIEDTSVTDAGAVTDDAPEPFHASVNELPFHHRADSYACRDFGENFDFVANDSVVPDNAPFNFGILADLNIVKKDAIFKVGTSFDAAIFADHCSDNIATLADHSSLPDDGRTDNFRASTNFAPASTRTLPTSSAVGSISPNT